jgi:hypothetical protein
VPLDDWLPDYDVNERHQCAIPAPPERALLLALEAPAAPDLLVRTLFRLRGVPRTETIAGLLQTLGFEQRERTATTFVGVGGRRILIGLDLVARSADGGSILSTETRVRATDARARAAFRAYWLVVGPFSALIRRRWLRAVARAARERVE